MAENALSPMLLQKLKIEFQLVSYTEAILGQATHAKAGYTKLFRFLKIAIIIIIVIIINSRITTIIVIHYDCTVRCIRRMNNLCF